MAAKSWFTKWFQGVGAPAQRGQPTPDVGITGNSGFWPSPQPARRPSKANQPELSYVGITVPWADLTNANTQRGQPSPYASWQHRPAVNVEHHTPFGLARYDLIDQAKPGFRGWRREDRGSQAYAHDSGRLTYDPIGAGVVFTKALPVFSPLIARVIPGTVGNFGVPTLWAGIPTGASGGYGVAGPQLGPLYDPNTLAALLGPTVAAAVVNQQYIPLQVNTGA